MRTVTVTAQAAWSTLARTTLQPQTGNAERGAHHTHELRLTRLQEDGAHMATMIMLRHGGVIVADSVGMGKTYVALRMIDDALTRNREVLLIVPATLRRKWRGALQTIDVMVVAANQPGHNDRHSERRVTLTSHSLVQRLDARRCGSGPGRLVVVDEAHQFRNPRTARYRSLARMTAHGHVLLLTATPINNRPADLYWLLRLFLGDGALSSAGVPDLRAALLVPSGRDDALMRRAANVVVVRRTRVDYRQSQEHDTPAMAFPRRHPPRGVAYHPDARELDLLQEVERVFPLLRLTAFDVPAQHGPRIRHQTGALVRYGLVKRLESSTRAFHASLLRLLRFLDAFADAVSDGGFIRPADVRVVDPLQLSLSGLIARRLPRHVDGGRLAGDTARDRELLHALLSHMPDGPDAKVTALRSLLGDIGSAQRIVFTEFTETADALFAALPQDGTALLHGRGARLSSGPASRTAVLTRFAPLACGVAPPPAREFIRTLIATDVLSEGMDLQDANHCISYDLPWNPVRLMQRAGRIDRLGSPHADVYVWYFEPPGVVERWIGLMRTLGIKLRTISGTIGAEHGALANEYVATRQRHVGGTSHGVSKRLNAGGPDLGEPDAAALAQLRELAARFGRSNRDAADDVADAATTAALAKHDTTDGDAIGAAAIGVSAADLATLLNASHGPLITVGDARSSPTLVFTARCRSGARWVECTALTDHRRYIADVPHTTQALVRLGHILAHHRFAPAQDDGHMASAIQTIEDGHQPTAAHGGRSALQAARALRAAVVHGAVTADPDVWRRADRILERLSRGVPIGVAAPLAAAAALTSLPALLDGLESALAIVGDDDGSRGQIDTILVVRERAESEARGP